MEQTRETSKIIFNPAIVLGVSDVDETIADLFVPAHAEMGEALNTFIDEGRALFLVSGSGFDGINKRVVDLIKPQLRKRVLVSHCSGAEVSGYDMQGNVLETPFYSKYDEVLTSEQKERWRKIVAHVSEEFQLEPHQPMAVQEFKKECGDNPLAVMFEDRGPQITFEFVNAYNLTTKQIEQLGKHIPNFDIGDLRIPVMERFDQLLTEFEVPITPRLGGMFALDLAIKGVSKTTSVKYVLENQQVLSHIGLAKEDIQEYSAVEIWGDKFSVINGGTDRHMCEALPKEVRAIDFRAENPEEFMAGYNIVVWDGKSHLHDGLLEYLQSR